MKHLVLLALLMASPSLAQVRPSPSGGDPMHQIVPYAEGQTVILEASPGFQLTVELGQGEQIRSAAAGDAASWQVSAPQRSSQFFVRPIAGAAPTNLTVVTNRRSYYFLLVAAPQMTATNALSVRFTFPQQEALKGDASKSAVKTAYKVSGAASIRPSQVWDDGNKTYLDWPENVEAPAIFAIDGAGKESLVNSFYRDGQFVIDGVHQRLLFRLDRLVARADRRGRRS